MKRIALTVLLMFAVPCSATSGTKMFTDKGGIEWWMGISTDTKPTGTTVPLGSYFVESDTKQQYRTNSAGAWVTLPDIVHLATLLAGEDQLNSVLRVEQQFSYCVDAVDKICKTQAGFVHSISCFGTDAASVAGRVRLVDDATVTGTAANELWGFEVVGLVIQNPVHVVLDVAFTRGLHLDFTTTTDVKCSVSFR